ncbi:5-formyltetrahydrofolate cyclo-ligase [Natronomonas sp. CBA1123]|jgi:5-formyltetrahydrofolate cyclo-ligase|uniref:5-formyltetrahydrofolate cyclo-ligase n=1 Tax=Natronomonas sp. CBA1123 TaxID=2668070 RepID=UPI0012EAA116|nr:5-formyltetrahydrofolate cyclo-ligase [Natronomonas sp. CBA1123]MUV88267.1 5-formyltetrahydrofolate cyclo-ligase [Natronomonas sp. CBA1123]
MSGKDSIRGRVWDRLEADDIARFPFPPHGRITNFDGADAAAERAMSLPELADADAVKANPDAPQLPLRRKLLHNGTTVYMAVPRLAADRPFVELDPEEISDLDAAATISQMSNYGRKVGPEDVPELDGIVVGSVAVTEDGARVGKGEGYSDLEYAVLRGLGLVDDDTPVVTTVHDVQFLEEDVDTERYDVPMDVVCTPTRTVRTETTRRRPTGIFWDDLDSKRLEEIPVLDRLREER